MLYLTNDLLTWTEPNWNGIRVVGLAVVRKVALGVAKRSCFPLLRSRLKIS